MIIAVQTWDLHLPGCQSLKDKRSILQSLKQGLRRSLNVAVSETDHQDLWQRSTLGVVSVASDPRILEQTLSSALRASEEVLERNLANYQIEYL